jgi:hypothetical protein
MKDMSCGKNQAGPGSPVNPLQGGDNTMKTTSVNRITITMSDEDFSKLDEIRKLGWRSKSHEIAWLVKEEWERFQKEERGKTPAEIVEAYVSRIEKKAADYVEPCHDARIIQFPIRQFSGSA